MPVEDEQYLYALALKPASAPDLKSVIRTGTQTTRYRPSEKSLCSAHHPLAGARRSEVLNAPWDQFDLEAAVWTKPAATTKQRCLHRAPKGACAGRAAAHDPGAGARRCEWVLPGNAEGKSLQDIKRFWYDVREKAQLPRVRIHDLRQAFAS